jgi:hypothetical protein
MAASEGLETRSDPRATAPLARPRAATARSRQAGTVAVLMLMLGTGAHTPQGAHAETMHARPRTITNMVWVETGQLQQAIMHAALMGQAELDAPLVDAIHALTPEGVSEAVDTGRFERRPEGFLVCNRADATKEQMQRVVEIVAARGHCFAHLLKDLLGYSGAEGKMQITFKREGVRYAEARRRHSPIEKDIQDDKCGELRDAGIIEPSLATDYALNCTKPSKKDADGNHTRGGY